MSVKHNDESAQQKQRGAEISEGSRQEEMGERGRKGESSVGRKLIVKQDVDWLRQSVQRVHVCAYVCVSVCVGSKKENPRGKTRVEISIFLLFVGLLFIPLSFSRVFYNCFLIGSHEQERNKPTSLSCPSVST